VRCVLCTQERFHLSSFPPGNSQGSTASTARGEGDARGSSPGRRHLLGAGVAQSSSSPEETDGALTSCWSQERKSSARSEGSLCRQAGGQGRPSERRGGGGRSSRRETCPILSTEPLKNFPLILLHSCWPNSKLEYFVNKIAKSTRYSILALLELIRFFYKRFRVSLWPCLKNCFLSRIYKD
jgi:hypothetical protein